jgi:hypothetical protein
VGVREGVGDGDGVGVGEGPPTDTSPHQVPQLLLVAAYCWSVHRVRSSSGSTSVLLKSPHRLSPVPSSLK